ncbi:TPA: hypothetical protein ACIV9D_004411, partial [Salmonella enterica subsp. enterica serovar Java]
GFMVVLPWRASEGAEEKSVMMTGWRDCHFTAKVSIFSGSLSTMTRSSGINARAFNFRFCLPAQLFRRINPLNDFTVFKLPAA